MSVPRVIRRLPEWLVLTALVLLAVTAWRTPPIQAAQVSYDQAVVNQRLEDALTNHVNLDTALHTQQAEESKALKSSMASMTTMHEAILIAVILQLLATLFSAVRTERNRMLSQPLAPPSPPPGS